MSGLPCSYKALLPSIGTNDEQKVETCSHFLTILSTSIKMLQHKSNTVCVKSACMYTHTIANQKDQCNKPHFII